MPARARLDGQCIDMLAAEMSSFPWVVATIMFAIMPRELCITRDISVFLPKQESNNRLGTFLD